MGSLAGQQIACNGQICEPKIEKSRLAGAGDGNRTRMTSLEGWSSTIELRPQQPLRPERLTPVAYRLPPAEASAASLRHHPVPTPAASTSLAAREASRYLLPQRRLEPRKVMLMNELDPRPGVVDPHPPPGPCKRPGWHSEPQSRDLQETRSYGR